MIDIEGHVPDRRIGTGHGRGVIAADEGGVWVANGWSRTVARIDPRTFELTSLMSLRKVPVSLALDGGAVWILCENGWLWRVPPGGSIEGVARLGRGARAMVASRSRIWVLREAGRLVGFDPESGDVALETDVGRGARNLVASDDALWVICRKGRRLLRLDPEAASVDAELRLPQRAIRMEADGRRLWVACGRRRSPRTGWLHAVDAGSATLELSTEIDGEPRGLAIHDGTVWVASAHRRKREGVIERLDRGGYAPQLWADTAWPVFGLAATASSLLATMSLRVGGPIDAGTSVFDAGAGGGGGGGAHHGG